MSHRRRPDPPGTAGGRSGVAWLALLAVFLLAAPARLPAEPVPYTVDPDHSGVTFTIRHFVSDVPGRFDDFQGTLVYDREDPAASRVEFTIQVASVDTDNTDRDEHLRSADFFDVQQFPTMTFTGAGAVAKDADTQELTGTLTLHGVTRQVTVLVDVLGTVKGPRGEKAGFRASFAVDRRDYGITWNRALDQGGVVLGDRVEVVVYVEADQQITPPA